MSELLTSTSLGGFMCRFDLRNGTSGCPSSPLVFSIITWMLLRFRDLDIDETSSSSSLCLFLGGRPLGRPEFRFRMGEKSGQFVRTALFGLLLFLLDAGLASFDAAPACAGFLLGPSLC